MQTCSADASGSWYYDRRFDHFANHEHHYVEQKNKRPARSWITGCILDLLHPHSKNTIVRENADAGTVSPARRLYPRERSACIH